MNIRNTINTETSDPAEIVTAQVAKIAAGTEPGYAAPDAGLKLFALPLNVGNLPVPAVLICEDDASTAASWLTTAANLCDDTSLKAAIEAQL